MLPIIETERLILRALSMDDAEDIYEYAKTPYVGPAAGWSPHKSLEETKIFIQIVKSNAQRTGLGVFAVVLKETNKVIGTIEIYDRVMNFKAQLGYSINHQYWGKGYAVEASKAVLSWSFISLNLQRVEVGLFPDNYQSERVCQKLGMVYEGIKHKAYLRYDGNVFDEKIYAMTDDIFYKLRREGKI